MNITSGSPAEHAWEHEVKQLSQGERNHRMTAVDVVLDHPQELNDVLESELWALREVLQGRS